MLSTSLREWQPSTTVPRRSLEIIAAGVDAPIRSADPGTTAGFLALELRRLARLFGCRNEIEDFVLEGCVDLVMRQFSHLSSAEMESAFELAAAGRLADLELNLYGSFDAGILARVLVAYDRYRRRLVAETTAAAAAVAAQELAEVQAEDKNRRFESEFPELVASARFSHWSQVPAFWYPVARRLGLLDLVPDHCHALLTECIDLARTDLLTNPPGSSALVRAAEIAAVRGGRREPDVLALAKVFARKRILFEQLISSPHNQ